MIEGLVRISVDQPCAVFPLRNGTTMSQWPKCFDAPFPIGLYRCRSAISPRQGRFTFSAFICATRLNTVFGFYAETRAWRFAALGQRDGFCPCAPGRRSPEHLSGNLMCLLPAVEFRVACLQAGRHGSALRSAPRTLRLCRLRRSDSAQASQRSGRAHRPLDASSLLAGP